MFSPVLRTLTLKITSKKCPRHEGAESQFSGERGTSLCTVGGRQPSGTAGGGSLPQVGRARRSRCGSTSHVGLPAVDEWGSRSQRWTSFGFSEGVSRPGQKIRSVVRRASWPLRAPSARGAGPARRSGVALLTGRCPRPRRRAVLVDDHRARAAVPAAVTQAAALLGLASIERALPELAILLVLVATGLGRWCWFASPLRPRAPSAPCKAWKERPSLDRADQRRIHAPADQQGERPRP